MSRDNEHISAEDNSLVEANRLLAIRLSCAQAFAHLYIEAYDALLHYGINFRDLREWKDSTLLDRAHKENAERGRVLILDYIERVKNAITAAIRRKSMRQV